MNLNATSPVDSILNVLKGVPTPAGLGKKLLGKKYARLLGAGQEIS